MTLMSKAEQWQPDSKETVAAPHAEEQAPPPQTIHTLDRPLQLINCSVHVKINISAVKKQINKITVQFYSKIEAKRGATFTDNENAQVSASR
jgi:hypothetical protein